VENSNLSRTKLVSFKKGTKARKKREQIVKALKKKRLPKKKFKKRTRRQSQFAIATATTKKLLMG